MAALFAAKVCNSALGTAKTILIQRRLWLPAGIFVAVAEYVSLRITKSIVTSGSAALLTVSAAAGIGCALACLAGEKLSRDRTYVNVILSDDREAMKALRDFLAEHHITNVATDSYTRDWDRKTITVTAYAETRAESRLINDYLRSSPVRFKRLIQAG